MKRSEKIAKLQEFADTLDIYRARVEVGTGDICGDRGVVWIVWNRIGIDGDRRSAVGLLSHGLRYLRAGMKRVEASIDE